jgi:type II secretory pathway component GspD/PulD (secretin)
MNVSTRKVPVIIALVTGLIASAMVQAEGPKEYGRAVITADSSGMNKAPTSKPKEVDGKPTTKYVGKKLSLNFSSIELAALFAIFANHSGNKLSIDPAIKGTIAVQYFDVPWDQAMYEIAARYNLAVKVENGTIHVKKNG